MKLVRSVNVCTRHSVAILSQAISCSNVRGVFPVHELFRFCLVQVSTTQFCSFPSFLVARASDGTDVPVSSVPASSSNMGSPNNSLPGLDGTGFRACTMEEKNQRNIHTIAKLPLLMQSISRFENCVQTLSQTVASYDAKITNIEQIVSSLAARDTTLVTNAASVSSGSGSARPWNVFGHGDGSQQLGPSGPMANGRLMTVEIRGVNLILSQAPKMNMHGVPSYYGSHVNNITQGLRIGPITLGKNQTYWTTNPSELSMTRCLTVQDATLCPREDPLF